MEVLPRPSFQSFPMLAGSRAQAWTYSPRYRRPRHFHGEPELNVVVHGSASFGIGDRVREVRAGELLSFPPGQDHVLLRGSPDLELFTVGMRAEFAADACRNAEATARLLHVKLSSNALASLRARCGDLTGVAGADQNIAELWQLALWSAKTGGSSLVEPHVITRRTLAICDRNPEVTRAELARSMRTDPTEISRHFHRDLGVTLSAYRQRLRVLRVIHAFDRGASLTSAALDAGFGSYSQCHRTFQSLFTQGPSDFLRSGAREAEESAFCP